MEEKIKQEIQAEYFRMGRDLTQIQPFTNSKKFMALSQYGFILQTDFNSLEDAENYVYEYYSNQMHLIRQ